MASQIERGTPILCGNFCRPSVIDLQIQDKDLLLPLLVLNKLYTAKSTAFDPLWFPPYYKTKEIRLRILR